MIPHLKIQIHASAKGALSWGPSKFRYHNMTFISSVAKGIDDFLLSLIGEHHTVKWDGKAAEKWLLPSWKLGHLWKQWVEAWSFNAASPRISSLSRLMLCWQLAGIKASMMEFSVGNEHSLCGLHKTCPYLCQHGKAFEFVNFATSWFHKSPWRFH